MQGIKHLERVMASLRRFVTTWLKLKVNDAKSAVDIPQRRKFLGFSFTAGRLANRRRIAPESLRRFKARIRRLTRRNWGISLQERVYRLKIYLTGWLGYFRFCETPSVLRDLDSWIRHRLRCVQWKQWKVYRRRKAELIRLGVEPELAHRTAWSAKGPWRISHTPGVRNRAQQWVFRCYGPPALGSAREHLTLLNRRGTDPYARWCRRGGAARRPLSGFDDTIVVFLSDHGEYLGAHGGMIEKWHTAYEEILQFLW